MSMVDYAARKVFRDSEHSIWIQESDGAWACLTDKHKADPEAWGPLVELVEKKERMTSLKGININDYFGNGTGVGPQGPNVPPAGGSGSALARGGIVHNPTNQVPADVTLSAVQNQAYAQFEIELLKKMLDQRGRQVN